MRIALTLPTNGAGKFAWTGWSNALKELGHEIVSLDKTVDLLICSTSSPSEDIIKFRQERPAAKIALNVLAWTDEDIPGIHNDGVQASQGNIEYARQIKPDIVFAQYSPKYRDLLLKHWKDKEGYKLGSMEMAVDTTVYEYIEYPLVLSSVMWYDIFYCGGYWPYKAQNINKFLVPVIQKYYNKHPSCVGILGKGWPMKTLSERSEKIIGYQFGAAKVCPNIHEPHSTIGGFDVVERVFKVAYCGGALVTDRVKELFDGFGFVERKHLISADTPEAYMEAIDDIVENPINYDNMRKQAHEFVRDNHTYIHRAQKLLKDLDL